MDARERDTPAALQYLSLPEKLENGVYDSNGNRLSESERHRARVVLHELPGDPSPWQCWGVVEEPLQPGQSAAVTFFNVGGSAVPGGAFTEWDPETAGPTFTEALLTVQSVSRAVGRARVVGRNDSPARVRAAAGLLFVPPMKPTSKGERKKEEEGSKQTKAEEKPGGGGTEEKRSVQAEKPAPSEATEDEKPPKKKTPAKKGKSGKKEPGGRKSGSSKRGGTKSSSSGSKES